jgi:membrane associated rhomboid family serine protease
MVMPLYDDNPLRKAIPPYLTWSLIALNVAVFVVEIGMPDSHALFVRAGVIPAVIFGEVPAPTSPATVTLVSYMFLHADVWHLFANMIFLWIFGDDIEDAMGRVRFLVFYLACGVVAALVFVFSDPGARAPLIGASGAVAGVVAAYLLLRPCAKVGVFIFGYIAHISAYWVIGAWGFSQLVHLIGRASDGVAYWSHVGGFVTGAALFVLMRRPEVALFECMQTPVPPAPTARFHRPDRTR